MKGQNQNFEKAVRPVFTVLVIIIYKNIKSVIQQFIYMLRHHVVSFLRADHGKLSSERPTNISVKA